MKHVLLTAVAAAGLLAASRADAAITIRAEANTGGGYVTIGTVTDQGAGDLNLSLGNVAASFSGAGVGVSINTALGDPTIPQPGLSVTANAATVAGAPALLLRLSFTQTDVTANSGGLVSDFALTSLLGGGAGVTISSFVDDANTAFGQTTPLFSHAFATSGQASSSDPTAVSGSYSETIVMVLSFTGGLGSINAGAQLSATPVPEPATLALFGAGLLGLGMAYRRRKAPTA